MPQTPKCYLTGTGVDKDLKQARLLYNEYSRHASQPYSAEARQLQRDIAAQEAEIAKAERAKRQAEQEKARQEKRRQEAERATAAANKRAVAAAPSKSAGGSGAASSSNRTSASQRSGQSRSAAMTQASNNRKTANRQAQGCQEWREDMGFGNFVIVTKYPNGCVSRVRYRPCPICHLTRKCGNCNGTGVCAFCHGQRVIINYTIGMSSPCLGCQQTGQCNLCKGTVVCNCTSLKINPYPGYAVASLSVIFPNGATIRNTAGYNGRDDKFTITPPGGTSTTFGDTPSSGNSSSSSRRSSGSCSKCGGSGYDTTAYQCAAAAGHGARQPYHSSLGSKCPYCSSVIDHIIMLAPTVGERDMNSFCVGGFIMHCRSFF